MDRKILFLCTLSFCNLILKASKNTASLPSTQKIVQKRYGIPSSLSQNQLPELDPTATGNPFPLPSSTVSAVGSPVRLSPVIVVTSSENLTIENLYGTSSSTPVAADQKEHEYIIISLICCPCFKLELFGFEKKNCCSSCCNEEWRKKCFSCCMI
jgi:hypothetical protein